MSKTKKSVRYIKIGKDLVPCLICGDSPEPKISASVKLSKAWAKMLAFWNLLLDYTADYLDSHKYPKASGLEKSNQKQK